MHFIAWIAAHFAPRLPYRLLVRLVFRLALCLRREIGDAVAEWRRCASCPRLPDVIGDDLRLLNGLMQWLERMARYALWMRANQLCGRRVTTRLDPHVVYATTLAPSIEHLYHRLAVLLTHLVRMEDEAAELAAQWKREAYSAGASSLPPSLRYGVASRPSPTSAYEFAQALILRSLAQQGVSKDEGLSLIPAFATGPPPHPHLENQSHPPLRPARERTPSHAHRTPLAPLRAA
jgi:hypothetical protein